MSKHAQAAANGGKHPRVGAGTDMGEVDPSLYSTDLSLPAEMWTYVPKPVPPPPPPSPKELQQMQDDRMDERDWRRGTASARPIATGLAVLGNVGRVPWSRR